jgi:hypothetical protein
MNCSKCQSKMTQLFISYVCDVCNPPNGVVPTTLNLKFQGFSLFHQSTLLDDIFNKKISIFISKNDALDFMRRFGMESEFVLKEVCLSEEITSQASPIYDGSPRIFTHFTFVEEGSEPSQDKYFPYCTLVVESD